MKVTAAVLEESGRARAFALSRPISVGEIDLVEPGSGRNCDGHGKCGDGLPAPAARAYVSPLTLTAEARTVVGSYLGTTAVPSRAFRAIRNCGEQGNCLSRNLFRPG